MANNYIRNLKVNKSSLLLQNLQMNMEHSYYLTEYVNSYIVLNIYTYPVVSFVGYSQVKRCAEMSRKLRFFKDQIHKASLVSAIQAGMQPDIELEELEVCLNFNLIFAHPCNYKIRYWSFLLLISDQLFFLFQIQLAEHEHELNEMNSNSEKLQHTFNELVEFKMVLEKVHYTMIPSL